MHLMQNHKTDKVMKMVRSGPKRYVKDLLTIWERSIFGGYEELPFPTILERAKEKFGLETRTVINYLNDLVEDEKLEKRVDNKRNTFYKPKDKTEVNKTLLKHIIDETPLKIALTSLKTVAESPKLFEKLMGRGIEDQSPIPSYYSARADSELVEKWRRKLVPQFKELLKKRHPTIEEKELRVLSKLMILRFFEFLEFNMRLNIFSSLKLKPLGVSKWKVFSGKMEKDLYAKVWLQLFETLILLLKERYDQHENLEQFLRETQGTSLLLVVEVNTDFPLAVEHVEKAWFERPRAQASN